MQQAIVDRNGRVLDDHGSSLIFGSEAKANSYLQPHIREHLRNTHGRVWVAPYRETRKSITEPAYAAGKGTEIK
jgi:hypothetical protein